MSNRNVLVRKAQPTLTEVHVNRPLTDLSLAFFQDQADYVARRVFPGVPVSKPSDQYFTYSKDWFLKSFVRKRAPGAKAARSGYDISTDTFNCLRDALGKAIPDPIRAAADVADLDQEAMRWLTQQMLIEEEVNWATKYFATGIWGTDVTGGTSFTKWSDAASDPIGDIKTGKRTIKSNTSIEPKVLVLGRLTYDRLAENPDVIDRVKYGQTPGSPAIATEVALAQLCGLDRVLVANAIRNTAVEGATASNSFIVGDDDALLVHAAPSPGLLTPSAGYTFVWSGAPGVNSAGMRMKSFRIEEDESDIIEAESWYDQKVVSTALGYFFSDAVD